MVKNYKRILFVLTFIFASLALAGCRHRIARDEAENYFEEIAHYAQLPAEPEPDPYDDEQKESPTEFDNTNIEATVDNLSPFFVEIEGEDARRYATQAADDANNSESAAANEHGESTIEIERPADYEGDAAIGDEGGIIGLIATYSPILRQGVNSMFPCQLLYVFVETTQDFVTIARGSDIYQLVAGSGGVSVSSRLPADNLIVAADWVVRRNPDAIVKFVDSTILGSSITSPLAATNLAHAITQRPDWQATTAARNNKILLLSEQMLHQETTRLAAQLLIAQMLYPDLFEDIDINNIIASLLSETTGIHFLIPTSFTAKSGILNQT